MNNTEISTQVGRLLAEVGLCEDKSQMTDLIDRMEMLIRLSKYNLNKQTVYDA